MTGNLAVLVVVVLLVLHSMVLLLVCTTSYAVLHWQRKAHFRLERTTTSTTM